MQLLTAIFIFAFVVKILEANNNNTEKDAHILVNIDVAAPAKDIGIDLNIHVNDPHRMADSTLEVLDEEWDSYKKTYNKKYASSAEEESRRNHYGENKIKVIKHNQLFNEGKVTFTLEMNEYADMHITEFVAQMNGYARQLNNKLLNVKKSKHAILKARCDDGDCPNSMDWRTKGAVTHVKNQSHCGSCWAFSSTGSLEGQHFLKTGKLANLSEQNLVDCVTTNYGCWGGWMNNSFTYVKDNGGINSEACYPYEAVDGECRYNSSCIAATCTGFTDLPPKDEEALKKAVATVCPISVAIDASHSSFQLYQSGVYVETDCSQTWLDHAVLVVGYGITKDGEDYWIVKNSWGTRWGEQGYIQMARNHNNMCGISTAAIYPLV